MIPDNEKKRIANEVAWQADKVSQRVVANKAQVSTATISQIKAGNWDSISDSMWRKVQNNLRIDLNWKTAITDNLKEIYSFCSSAQSQGMAICIADDAGKGKSNGYKYYDRTNSNVIHIECKASWTKKTFVRNLLISMGVSYVGTFEEMLEMFNEHIKKMHKPLLILDQADKLKDPQLDLFMEFYNDHEGHLGIILSGVKALEKRIDKGRQRKKVGFDEIYSRFGSKYITLNGLSRKDVQLVCYANDVEDEEFIQQIYDTCGGDFRRVRREIQKIHLSRNPNNEIKLSA